MIRCIGHGGYGQVWLARNVLGTFRAVKIIYRNAFEHQRPYEREFEGIQKFEPISRSHPGLISVLHVGRNETEGFFYYVMELADDAKRGDLDDPDSYVPRTLESDLAKQGHLPIRLCIETGKALSSALQHLHDHGLVHRDVKPSNVISVKGVQKFADIGLVSGIGDGATFVGTEGYVPPEGPGRPTADLFGLGKLLYQIRTGKTLEDFPEFPILPDELTDGPLCKAFRGIVLKACELNVQRRFQSGAEMYRAMSAILPTNASTPFRPAPGFEKSGPVAAQAILLGQYNREPDGYVADLLKERLFPHRCQFLPETEQREETAVVREIEELLKDVDSVIVLLSAEAARSGWIQFALGIIQQLRLLRDKPKVLAVRLACQDPWPWPEALSAILENDKEFLWMTESDDAALLKALSTELDCQCQGTTETAPLAVALESVGGAVPLDSQFYIERPVDEEFCHAIQRGDSIVLAKGARQMGKTSLLARGLQHARQCGHRVILTDLQRLNRSQFDNLETFFQTLADTMADQLDLDLFLADVWNLRRSPNANFERYVVREVLKKEPGHIVWGIDETDRLFGTALGGEVFSLLRSWHNQRALDPEGPWARLTLAIAYATEAHLFISDMVQSPFNVGTTFFLEDFNALQIDDMNRRYGVLLKTKQELERLSDLLGGHPFLLRRAFNELVTQDIGVAEFEKQALVPDGPFDDHLRRILLSVTKEPELGSAMKGVLSGHPDMTAQTFYRLRAAGLLSGSHPDGIRLRCRLYRDYLNQQLL